MAIFFAYKDLTSLYSLLEIVHADSKLFLVFEFLDMDLKKYMESVNAPTPATAAVVARGLGSDMIKVCPSNRAAVP